jgi:D-arabinose 1-dehydrogenase-like Zn-dependent alcohol dehydrogenase
MIGAMDPVSVRDGDVLIIGADNGMCDGDLDITNSVLREALGGISLRVVVIPGHSGVTVLRPERTYGQQ